MRRLWCALCAALLLVLPMQAVLAKGLVLRYQTTDPGNIHSLAEQEEITVGALEAKGRRRGVDFDVMSTYGFPTEWARTGVTGFGTYSWIVLLLNEGTTSSGEDVAADSIALYPYPSVPILMVAWGQPFVNGGSNESLGVESSAESQFHNYQGSSNFLVGRGFPFRSNSRNETAMASAANLRLYPGGVRVLIGAKANSAFYKELQSSSYAGPGVPATNPDSCDFLGDTARVWSRLYTNKTGAKELTVAMWAHQPHVESSPEIVWDGLAHLDSLAAGDVFGVRQKPLKVAFVVRGGGTVRSQVSQGGGIMSDSAAIKASIDSLDALGVPFVITVPPDSLSLGNTAQQVSWYLRANNAHFSPYSLTAITDSTKGDNASWTTPIDPLGRYRKRVAFSDNSHAGADTSVRTLVQASYYLLGQRFGASRVDHLWVPAEDDWTPIDYDRMTIDSLLSAMASGGAVGLVANIRDRTTTPAWSRTNPRGYYSHERREIISYATNGLKRFKIIATPAYADSGAVPFYTSAAADGDLRYPWFDRQNMFWNGLTKGQTLVKRASNNGRMRALPDSADSRVHIYTIHVGDLGSGTRSDAATRPLRPGYWQIKNIVNAIKTINALAGRTVIDIVYPEAVEP